MTWGTAPNETPYDLYIQFELLASGWPDPAPWPDALTLACGFQSFELVCGLIGRALDDERATSEPQRRIRRFVDVAELILVELGAVLADTTLPSWAEASAPPTAPSPGLDVLARVGSNHRGRIVEAYYAELGGLSFRTGLERQLSGLHRVGDSHRPTLDYASLVAPASLVRLGRLVPFGAEDHLFCTVHQITECWLRIVHHEIDRCEQTAGAGSWAQAANHVRNAAAALRVATRVAGLLDAMVLADYHPLRVSLRDGSGAQSKAARELRAAAHRAYLCVQQGFEASGTSLLAVLDRPVDHPALHALQAAVQDLGRRCQAFLFEHYLLANSVLGADNLGSLGYAVRVLGERAVAPMFKDLDQAKHDFTIITNLRHGGQAGSIVLADELAVRPGLYEQADQVSGVCDASLIREGVERYFACIAERDADGWLRLFTPDVVFRDCVQGRPFHGRRHLKVFIDTTLAVFTELRPTLGEIRIEGNHAEADWSFEAVVLALPVNFSGREKFEFDGKGLIRQALVLWEPAAIAAQLWHAKVPASPETPTAMEPMLLATA